MRAFVAEDEVEQDALGILTDLGYEIRYGAEIESRKDIPNILERPSASDVILEDRLTEALLRLNPDIPRQGIAEAVRKVRRLAGQDLLSYNHTFHTYLTSGVTVEYRNSEGRIVAKPVWLLDTKRPERNDVLAVNQFTVVDGDHRRRPDIVLFVNGMPLVVIELKNPADEKASVYAAYNQLQTYMEQIPLLMRYSAFLVISDSNDARAGTLTSPMERFMPWKTVDGREVAPPDMPLLDVLFEGMLKQERLIDLICNFIVFEDDDGTTAKKLAAYHQFHAVNKAVATTKQAAGPEGDRRCGVVWHTQGSGKSLSMVFYTGKLVRALDNPTVVVITDRNDLDDQLYQTFCGCQELLRQTPKQASSRENLRELLRVASGGVIFTTVHKFFPEDPSTQHPLLSDRRNIVVIADEAHRSQYDFIDGFARHMRDALPHASFIGFTGTPIELSDRSTQAVFGNYIDTYDIEQAVHDGATVPIYYESRLAKLSLNEGEIPRVDDEFEEITEGQELYFKEQLKTKWSQLEALVGTQKRLSQVAADIVSHFEDRLSAMDGKGMIVCMSRRICVELYDEIAKLRPDWHDDSDMKGAIKVVMTGSASDPLHWQPHICNNVRKTTLSERMKDPSDELKLVIVRDMWLTGFDVPPLHTMYIDKPMKGHTLMQAIARVNRVYGTKPAGLIVDYLGIAQDLKKALSNYTESDRKLTGIDKAEAVAVMLEKYSIVRGIFHGFDVDDAIADTTQKRLHIRRAANFVLEKEDGKKRCIKAVGELSRAFALAVPDEQALAIRDELSFYQAVRASLLKTEDGEGERKYTRDEVEHGIRQIVSNAVATNEILDICEMAGIDKPDISIFSEEFMEEVRAMPQRNLALEALRKLLNDEIRAYQKKNAVQSRSFAEMLERSFKRYDSRSIDTVELIDELLELAREVREAHHRGEALGLSEEEVAFYDALADNESAREVLGDEKLKELAMILVEDIRNNISIDWTVRETAQARIRVIIKRRLRKYGYPPDKQKLAVDLVLRQAKLLCNEMNC
jgi:type I restriction enzyme R subunit